jgi:hypothetical protein
MNDQQFLSKCDSSGGPDACWPWKGARSGSYGIVRRPGIAMPVRAHRVAWEIANKRQMPAELCGCHTCDNPICTNPSHVFPGTNLENVRDSVAKGRNSMLLRRKLLCKRGHPLVGSNIIWRHISRTRRNRTRTCRACRDLARARKAGTK